MSKITTNYCQFLLCFFILICIGCSNKIEKNDEEIIVDLKKIAQNVSIFDIYSKIEIVPLETNNQSLIKSITKLIFHGNKYYVLDDEQKAIFIFDNRGRFIYKLMKVGKGPGEYRLITDFQINPYTNNIEILEPWGNMLIYGPTGNFISNYKIPIKGRSVHYFAYLDSSTLAFYSLVEKNSIVIYSKLSNKILNTMFEVPEVVKRSPLQTSKSPFFAFNGKIYFYQGFMYNIYLLDKSGLSKVYSWNFKENNLNVDKLPKDLKASNFPNYILSKDFVNSFLYHIEKHEYVITRFLCGKNWHTLFYNKLNKETLIIDKFKENISPPFSAISFPGGIITMAEPSQIGKYVKPEILDEENKKKLNSLKVDDNPVIINFCLKHKE